MEEAKTLEGDSAGEDEVDVEEGELGVQPGGEEDRWWDGLAAELAGVFSHWSSLTASFQWEGGTEPSLLDSGVNLQDVRAFYAILDSLPLELHESVLSALDGLLRRPRRRFDRKQGARALTWVLILLEVRLS